MASGSLVQVGSGVRHIPLPQLACDIEININQETIGEGIPESSFQHSIIGGFIAGGKLAWRASGPRIEIVDILEPGCITHKAAWTFGAIMHNAGAKVTAVCGVGLGTVSQVAVGVDLGGDKRPQGLLALLSLHSSRVTRVFNFAHKVTSVCMVSGGEVRVDAGTLAPELRPWHGVIAVGTAHGTLHLLDLALDLGGHKVTSDELSPATLKSFSTPDPQAEVKRINAVRQGAHLTMCMTDRISYGGHFQLVGPDDSILFETSSNSVSITAITFIPQLASLIVGYNFGSFQIINLSTLTIDCTSPYEESVPPVLSFACQEPENDPKNFVYLWLCRSWGPTDKIQENQKLKSDHMAAMCTMYAMNYDEKVWIEGHGLWYQGLASISPRFEFTAMGGLGFKGQPVLPSCVYVAMTVQQTTHNSILAPVGSTETSALATPDEESGPVPEKSLCIFGWAGGLLEKGHITVHHYLAVFDINQWYQAQMPSTLKLDENTLCPFMSFHELDRVPGCTANGGRGSESILGAAPKPVSWARHISRTCNESDWFPSSLSYDCNVLTSESLMEYQCLSTQQAALNYLASCGPSALVSPVEIHGLCLFAGLITHDPQQSSSGSSMMAEREALLNIALDGQLIPFLIQCVVEFSEGRFTGLGCSLPSLLEWAWTRVSSIKASNDNLCMPLFDVDCGVMNPSSIATLEQNLTSLAALTTIITHIRDYVQINMITLQGADELESRVQVVGLLMLHLSVVLWFYYCELLSHSLVEDVEDCHVPYPGDLLHQIYKNRRSEIRKLSSSLRGDDLLLIDCLIEDACSGAGFSIKRTWNREEDGDIDVESGMYPPPSLHALLDIFLLPNVTTTTKHRIVQYLFLDLASLLSEGYLRVVEELVKYPSSFSLSPSHIKLTQAFWLIDHKDFQEGLKVLLDPLVNTTDITPSQHHRIIRAFLFQDEHSRALTYSQIRRPPQMSVDDIRLHLTLLLANGLINEAFLYQRSHRLKDNTQDLLNHLFTGCEQLGKLESIIHLPLSPIEEDALVAYLRESSNTSAHDYLLVYYLKKDRYREAALLQESLRGGLGLDRKRQGARTALVHAYLTHLPDVTEKLASSCMNKPKVLHNIYAKPQPLSAKIRQAMLSPKSRSGTQAKHMDYGENPWSVKGNSALPYTPFRNHAQRRKAYDYLDESMSEIQSVKRKRASRDASHIVFPSRIVGSQSVYSDESEGEAGLFSPAPKRSRFGESLLREDTCKLMESILKRSVQSVPEDIGSPVPTMSAELLSLLRTPRVIRKRKSVGGQDSLLVDTPQSILKVKQSIQRPLSPSPVSDTSLPLFPRIVTPASLAKKINVSEDAGLSRATDNSLTPKQLRFHLPKNKVDINASVPCAAVETCSDKEDSSVGKEDSDIGIEDSSIVRENNYVRKEDIYVGKEDNYIRHGECLSEEREIISKEKQHELKTGEKDIAGAGIDSDEQIPDSLVVDEPEVIQAKEETSLMTADMEGIYERSFEVQEEEENEEEDTEEYVVEDKESEEMDNSFSSQVSIKRGSYVAYQMKLTSVVSSENPTIISPEKPSVLRNPFSGVPTPRQPLRSLLPLRSDESAVRLICENSGSEEKVSSLEGENESEEVALQDITDNETFYSIREDESGELTPKTEVVALLLPQMDSTNGKDNVNEVDTAHSTDSEKEEMMGVEKSMEVQECDLDTDDSLCDSEKADDNVALHTKIQQSTVELHESNVFEDTASHQEELSERAYEKLNKSECIPPFYFSDSENSDEEPIRNGKMEEIEIKRALSVEEMKERVISVLNESFEESKTEIIDIKDSKADITDMKESSQLAELSEKAEDPIPQSGVGEMKSVDVDEMIPEALSEVEDESYALHLDASEEFSPLVFSDESDVEVEERLEEAKNIHVPNLSGTSGLEYMKQIIGDDEKVAIAESAEENSMEASVPEEYSVEACIPKETSRIKQSISESDCRLHLVESNKIVPVTEDSQWAVQIIDDIAEKGSPGKISVTPKAEKTSHVGSDYIESVQTDTKETEQEITSHTEPLKHAEISGKLCSGTVVDGEVEKSVSYRDECTRKAVTEESDYNVLETQSPVKSEILSKSENKHSEVQMSEVKNENLGTLVKLESALKDPEDEYQSKCDDEFERVMLTVKDNSAMSHTEDSKTVSALDISESFKEESNDCRMKCDKSEVLTDIKDSELLTCLSSEKLRTSGVITFGQNTEVIPTKECVMETTDHLESSPKRESPVLCNLPVPEELQSIASLEKNSSPVENCKDMEGVLAEEIHDDIATVSEGRVNQMEVDLNELPHAIEDNSLPQRLHEKSEMDIGENFADAVSQSVNVTPPRRSRRLSSTVKTPTTPTRRSRRLSEKLDPLTPSREASKSDRNINEVPTPLTRSKSASPGFNLTTPRGKMGRVKPQSKEVDKVVQKLLSSPQKDIENFKSSDDRVIANKLSESELAISPASKSPLRRSSRLSTPKKDVLATKDKKTVTPLKNITDQASPEITPSKLTPRSRKTSIRLTQGFEGLATIEEDSILASNAGENVTDIPKKSPSRRVCQSSVSDAESSQEAETPSKRKSRPLSEDELKSATEIRTPLRRSCRSSVIRTPQIPEERTPPKSEDEMPVSAQQLRRSIRKQRTTSATPIKDETTLSSYHAASKSPSRISRKSLMSSPVSSFSQASPSRSSTRSSVSSLVTSVKDSESSEEEKKLISKRKMSKKRSLRLSTVPDLDNFQSSKEMSSRISLASSIQSSKYAPSSSVRSSIKSLKLYGEDSAFPLTPEEYPKRKTRAAKKSKARNTSVLMVDDSQELSEELVLTSNSYQSQDIMRKEETSSLELSLVLLEGAEKGKKLQRSTLLRNFVGSKKAPRLPLRSVRSMRVPSQNQSNSPSEEAAVITKVEKPASRRSRRGVQRSSLSEDTVVEIEPFKHAVNVIVKETPNVESDLEQENKFTEKSKAEQIEERIEIDAQTIPHFTFAEPKPITSSRKMRALENLMGEAVEFLFSPPQAHGRIAKTQAKVEGSKQDSLESEEKSSSSKDKRSRKNV